MDSTQDWHIRDPSYQPGIYPGSGKGVSFIWHGVQIRFLTPPEEPEGFFSMPKGEQRRLFQFRSRASRRLKTSPAGNGLRECRGGTPSLGSSMTDIFSSVAER